MSNLKKTLDRQMNISINMDSGKDLHQEIRDFSKSGAKEVHGEPQKGEQFRSVLGSSKVKGLLLYQDNLIFLCHEQGRNMRIRNKTGLKFGIGIYILTLLSGCVEGYEAYESKHPLSNKVGFYVSGKLKDGTKISYRVKRRHRLSFQTLEEVIYKKNGHNVLIDFNADGKVDRVLIGKADELIGREFFGLRFRYDEKTLTEAKAKEIIHDADRIFNRVKATLKVNDKLESYGKSVKNPFR